MLQFSTRLDGLDKALGGFEAAAARCDSLSKPLDRLGHHHVRKMNRVLRSGERGVQARNPSGLAASGTFRVDRNTLDVGSNKVYAGVQQRGGTIESSRPDGWLAIPAGVNVGARGNPRFDSPRKVSDGEFRPTKKGGLVFGIPKKRPKTHRKKGLRRFAAAAKEAAAEGFELLFVLVKRVTIPARRYVTHDPDDQKVWDRYASNWILRGKA